MGGRGGGGGGGGALSTSLQCHDFGKNHWLANFYSNTRMAREKHGGTISASCSCIETLSGMKLNMLFVEFNPSVWSSQLESEISL